MRVPSPGSNQYDCRGKTKQIVPMTKYCEPQLELPNNLNTEAGRRVEVVAQRGAPKQNAAVRTRVVCDGWVW